MTDINVKDMFSDDEIKEMVKSKLNEKIEQTVSGMDLEKTVKEIAIDLFSYFSSDKLFAVKIKKSMEELVSKVFLECYREDLDHRMGEIISRLNYYNLFEKYDSPGIKFLEEALENNREVIIKQLTAKMKEMLQNTESNQYALNVSMELEK